MCKIFAVINKSGKANKTIADLVDANLVEIAKERSGYSVFRDDRSLFYSGNTAYFNIDRNAKYNNERVFIIHSRTKTCGEDGFNGLHLQSIGDWVFAHNGSVDKYRNVLKKSDSYYFFKHLLLRYKKLAPEQIENFASDCGFSGKGLIYNKKTTELIFFSSMPGQLTVLDDAIILSSYEIEKAKKVFDYHNVMGFNWVEFKGKEEITGILHQEKFDDKYIRFKDFKMVVEQDIRITDKYTAPTGGDLYTGKRWDIQTQSWVEEEGPDDLFEGLAHYTLDDFKLSKKLRREVARMRIAGFMDEEIMWELINSGDILPRDLKPSARAIAKAS